MKKSTDTLILLNKKSIQANLKNKLIEIDILDAIDSTNLYLKKYIKNRDTRICIAEQQTKGAGRLGREWHSPFGLNIYFSCLYCFNKDINELSGLGLVVSLAALKTLQTYIPNGLNVKWPNDIFYENKKMAGILIEAQTKPENKTAVIIGIGINVNMQNDDNKISQAWTSLFSILNKEVDRNLLCATLTNNLMDYLDKFDKQSLIAFKEEWHASDCLFNKKITLQNATMTTTGIAVGINDLGNLLLKTEKDEIKIFSSGDTSIKKE